VLIKGGIILSQDPTASDYAAGDILIRDGGIALARGREHGPVRWGVEQLRSDRVDPNPLRAELPHG
jgi:hypothetical protein